MFFQNQMHIGLIMTINEDDFVQFLSKDWREVKKDLEYFKY